MRTWRRFVVVPDTHAQMMCRESAAFLFKFLDRFKPHTIAHIGDAFDLTALRSGAAGTVDEGADLNVDLVTAQTFLDQLFDRYGVKRREFLCGNHERRAWNLSHHPRAVVAEAAGHIVATIKGNAARLGVNVTPYNGNAQAVMLGSKLRLMHGTFFNEQAARDHAEAFAPMGGCVIFGNTHKAADVRGRRADCPRAVNIGWLGRTEAAHYAEDRRATLAWSNAFAYGEYCDDAFTVTLCQRSPCGAWRMP